MRIRDADGVQRVPVCPSDQGFAPCGCSTTTIFDRGDDNNCPLKLIVCRVGFGSPFLGFEKGFCFPPAFRAWGWSEGVARTEFPRFATF